MADVATASLPDGGMDAVGIAAAGAVAGGRSVALPGGGGGSCGKPRLRSPPSPRHQWWRGGGVVAPLCLAPSVGVGQGCHFRPNLPVIRVQLQKLEPDACVLPYSVLILKIHNF